MKIQFNEKTCWLIIDITLIQIEQIEAILR